LSYPPLIIFQINPRSEKDVLANGVQPNFFYALKLEEQSYEARKIKLAPLVRQWLQAAANLEEQSHIKAPIEKMARNINLERSVCI
jgi:hypothetical protein